MTQLLSLPLEILTAIVDHLGPSKDHFYNFDHDYEPDVSLYYLAQTCRTFRDICIPKLYEICSAKTGQLRRGLGVIRTLAARPDIASRVKRVIVDAGFCLDDVSTYGIVISAKDAALYNRILEKKLDMSTIKPLPELPLTDAPEQSADKIIGGSLACLALALVPNITSAIFSCYGVSLGSFNPGAFPELLTFSLQHGDTKFSTEFNNAQGVLGASPNILRFIGWSTSFPPDSCSYLSMKQVVLTYSRLNDEEVALLPKVFPLLEMFSYVDGGPCVSYDRSASPRAMSGALLSLRKTLKDVELGSYDISATLDDIDGLPVEPMESLARMEVLEGLRLHALYIYQPDDAGDEEEAGADGHGSAGLTHSGSGTKLVEFLPRSIKDLYIDGLQPSSLDDILALAQAASYRFPNLAQVAFPELDPSLEEVVRHAYEKQGIKCTFEEEDVYDYQCYCT